jgi:predicted ATPase
MLLTLAISGYRSLRDLSMPLGGLNLVTGPNGSGKSNVYRALRLLAETAQGSVISSLAREGGLQSTLWAGPETISHAVLRGDHPVQGTTRKSVVSLRLGFASDSLGYAIDLGLPPPSRSVFSHDPEIKREYLWAGPVPRPASLLVDRRGPLVRARGADGEWIMVSDRLATFDSMMTHCADPRNTPEMLILREHIHGWRFYDQFRTDAGAPARQPQIGTHTPVLANDGADAAAAYQTIAEIGEIEAVDHAVADAFPGSRVMVSTDSGRFELQMHQHGLLRPLKAAELSDGTLRYLLWIAALLTPRPPGLLILNEPETSLHPDLLPALARLITRTSERSQVVVVSHAPALIDALQSQPECQAIVLGKQFGETVIENEIERDGPTWHWLPR